MTDQLETVARAIDPELWKFLDYDDDHSIRGIARSKATSLRRAQAAIDAMKGWQPIEDCDNEGRWFGVRVLLLVPPYGATTGHFDGKWHMHSVLNRSAEPTHWMPLPAPPEAEAAEAKEENPDE